MDRKIRNIAMIGLHDAVAGGLVPKIGKVERQ